MPHPPRDPRRRFTRRERAALLIASAGLCSECGDPLDPDFHADHRQAWSLGGVTDVQNGQALCPTCNRRKAAHSASPTDPARPGSDQADASEDAAGAAFDARHRHNPAFALDPAAAGQGAAHECHKEKLS
jgi:hypothetical protein